MGSASGRGAILFVPLSITEYHTTYISDVKETPVADIVNNGNWSPDTSEYYDRKSQFSVGPVRSLQSGPEIPGRL